MDKEAVVVAQIVRLFRERSGVVWELVGPTNAPRPGDVPLCDLQGQPIAYARPFDTVSSAAHL